MFGGLFKNQAYTTPPQPITNSDSWMDQLGPNLDDVLSNMDEDSEDTTIVEASINEEETIELPIDMYVKGSVIIIQTPIIGATEDEVSVTISGQQLTIHKHGQAPEVGHSAKPLVQECHWGNLSRAVDLPHEVDANKAKAKLENGVLTIQLPISSRHQTQTIKVS